MRILIVDDEAVICASLTELLQSEGHKVVSVTLGSEALSAALMHDFELLIADLNLPDMPGIEVVRAIKAQAPQLPVMVLTGLDAAEWRQPCEDAGVACFLTKPFSPDELLGEVRMIQKARLNLRVALVDADPIHRTRVTKTLDSLGCIVQAYAGATVALTDVAKGTAPSLWVVDASDPDIFHLLKQVPTQMIPVFVFSDSRDSSLEENLMRVGAALFLPKPIDVDTLLTQASFLARP